MPYFTLGYPDRETSLAVVEAIAPHSDLLELGMPFSDPIADGPTIQRSTQASLEQGTTLSGCLEMLTEIRHRGVGTPATLMGYYNPILAYGEEQFVSDALEAGADGLIVPDLPPEESGGLATAAQSVGLAFVHFLAPTSNPARIALVTAKAGGFIYMVSVTGVTGARAQVNDRLAAFVRDLRDLTDAPIAVGFGISRPEQAAQIGRYADGIIVGSALIDVVDRSDDKPAAARKFVGDLHAAISEV